MNSFSHLMYRLYAITEVIYSMPSGCGQEASMMQKLLKFFDQRKAEKWKATNNIKVPDYQNQIKVPTYLIGEPDTKFDISAILLVRNN